jgi:hypothetical protein
MAARAVPPPHYLALDLTGEGVARHGREAAVVSTVVRCDVPKRIAADLARGVATKERDLEPVRRKCGCDVCFARRRPRQPYDPVPSATPREAADRRSMARETRRKESA